MMDGALFKLAERRAFDRDAYCALYPDIAKAVASGDLRDPWDHYDRHGRAEGRTPCRFDERFYLQSYPGVADAIAAGTVASALQHYILFGRGRGYVPHPAVPRAADPAAPASPFGGLWIDSANAADRIAGRLETGQITAAQAALLRFFLDNGYVILSGAIDPALIDAARADLDTAYAGGFDQLRFEAPGVSPAHTTWQPGVDIHPAKALDIHHFSPAVRQLMFAPAISDFLALIFEGKALASQTLGFLRGSAQEGHQDSAYVVYTLPLQFAASWVALEDVTVGAGELFYYPGSHRLPDFLYGERYKSISEARRMGGDKAALSEQARQHVGLLDSVPPRFGLTKQVFAAKKGDVLIWHSDLVHGGHPVSRKVTRKSIVTHYCPKYLAPAFAEQNAVTYYDQDGHLFTTGHYLGFPPLGWPPNAAPDPGRRAAD